MFGIGEVKAQKLLLLSLASKKLIKMNDEGEMMMKMTMMILLVVMIIRSEY